MRTLLATTALVVSSLTLGLVAAPAPASAATTSHCGDVHAISHSWLGITAVNLSCAHATQAAQAWSSRCPLPNPGSRLTCAVPQHYSTHSAIYACIAHGLSNPRQFVVGCTARGGLHRVTFTYYPHQ